MHVSNFGSVLLIPDPDFFDMLWKPVSVVPCHCGSME